MEHLPTKASVVQINSQTTAYAHKFKQCDKTSGMYVGESHCMPGCGTPSYSQGTTSRQANPLPAKLADHHPGPMGLEYSASISDRPDI